MIKHINNAIIPPTIYNVLFESSFESDADGLGAGDDAAAGAGAGAGAGDVRGHQLIE